MDDLNGLDWSASSSNASKAPTGTGNYYPTLRPTPSPANSGRSTPLSAQVSSKPKAFVPPPKSGTPDSFSNLVNFGSSKTTTLTLQQQQEKLQAEKRKQEAEKKKQYESQFGSGQFWDGLGNKGQSFAGTPPITSRTATPSTASPFGLPSPPAVNGVGVIGSGDDADLFAAFNADTKVDASTNYPIPSNGASRQGTPALPTTKVDLSNPQAWENPSSTSGADFGDDDDPFGLGQMSTRNNAPPPVASTADDDDFLGDLGKPVEEVRKPVKATPAPVDSDSEPESNDPWDKAVSELVDMGFSAENSRRALTESGSGLDVQAAVGWLLNDAHRQAKAKKQGREPSGNNGTAPNEERRERPQNGTKKEATPAWMREEGRSQSQPRRDDSRSPAGGDIDLSKTAAAVGSNLFKTANSLWKTSQKKVQKAVADFQYDSDPSQPKWMREAAEREAQERRGAGRGRDEKVRPQPEVTDEALMLEGDSRPAPRKSKAPEPRFAPSSSSSSRDQSPAFSNTLPERPAHQPRWQQSRTSTPLDAKSRLSKQALEEQTAQAYVSPSRRKKANPQPQAQEPEPDLLFSSGSSQSRPVQAKARPTPKSTSVPSKPSTPIPTRPKAPQRSIPNLSSIALASSNQHRLAGTTHFKRGDYAAAHTSYTSSLSALPQSHPITIILLCNRALTSLKTGIPKEAVDDANKAIAVIGVSRGEGEIIDLGTEKKDMKEFFGKALMRKAEALEQMEQWKNAGAVWQEAVEAGVGGANSIQGRQRCEKALAPKPAATPRNNTPKPRPAPKPKSALSDLGPSKDSEAVERLRAANAAADKADDEKFALADSVDAKISQWRDGKRDNLRALLGSLDKVLWENSGWKKVGMHELVVNSKVKIAYMKAIGKCHPDKLPQDASTEIKLIAATVFSTLNESWDKFKAENGM